MGGASSCFSGNSNSRRPRYYCPIAEPGFRAFAQLVGAILREGRQQILLAAQCSGVDVFNTRP